MNSKYKVVTLCGSSKFKEEFIQAQRELTLNGYIVISLGLFGHAEGYYNTIITKDVKNMLDDMHMCKIDMSDMIYVINKNDYIGHSTQSEINYAKSKGKSVVYMFNHND